MAGTGHAKRKATDNGNEAHKGKKVKSRRVGLSAFENVPIDLLPNICQYLSPHDLVNLCDAALMFRKALCCSPQTRIWRDSRETEGVFEIPDGMNEYRWAQLVFGSRCMECGIEEAKKAEFHLRRRICDGCFQENCIDPRKQEDFQVDFMKEAYRCSLAAFKSTNGHNTVYWITDVEEQHEILLALKRDIELNLPGATRALERYIIARRKYIRLVTSEAHAFMEYEASWHKKLHEQYKPLFAMRYDQISRRFVELGYNPRDFPHDMSYHKLVRSTVTTLTEQAWQTIREAFEDIIKAQRDRRKQFLLDELLSERISALDSVLAAHKFKDLAPGLWKSSPQLPVVALLPPIKSVLLTWEADHDEAETAFGSLVPRINEFLHTAYDELRISFRDHSVTTQEPFLADLLSDPARALQLASVILRCTRCQCLLYGFQDIHAHQCSEIDTVDDEYLKSMDLMSSCVPEQGGAQAACIVIRALGLDPKTATTLQVDELMVNKRLRCGSMEELRDRTVPTLRGFTWRGLIRHILEEHETADKQATLKDPQIIPQSCLPEIFKEETRIYHDLGSFACIRCDVHFNFHLSPGDRHITCVAEHIRYRHRLPYAIKDEDFVAVSDHGFYSRRIRHGVEYHVQD